MHCRPRGTKEIEIRIIHDTLCVEPRTIFVQRIKLPVNYSTNSSPEEERMSSTQEGDLGLITQGKFNG